MNTPGREVMCTCDCAWCAGDSEMNAHAASVSIFLSLSSSPDAEHGGLPLPHHLPADADHHLPVLGTTTQVVMAWCVLIDVADVDSVV